MKKTIFAIAIGLLTSGMSYALKGDEKAIKDAITGFSEAGDMNDVAKLAPYLDDNYRVVMNRLFGSNEVSVMPKSVYLDKIKSKEFGGDKRKVTFEDITINGTTASAKVMFKGEKMTFVSIIVLLKNEKGNWLLVSDIPLVK